MRKWMIWMVCLGLGLGPCVRAFAMDGSKTVTVWEEGQDRAPDGEQPATAKSPDGDRPAQPDPLKLNAQSAVLADGLTGRVLYGKGEDTIRPMASTTKIMTCILALELGNPDDVVTATKEAAGQPKVHLGVQSGQTFYLKDLLYSLMLESHNDAAVMIAEHIGGSVPGFARLMNEKAKALGCENTYFITPNGLDAKETDEAGVEDGSRAVIGGLVAGKTVKTTRTNQLMAFITLEDLLGPVEVIVFPRDYEANRDLFTEDSKLFIRGRVSIGDDPVGKLVCEQVIPFDSIPKELWLQFPDMETYQSGEQRLLTSLRSSEGKDRVVIYLQKERAKKVLPANWNVQVTPGLLEELGRGLGEKNVKVVEKGLEKLGKMN